MPEHVEVIVGRPQSDHIRVIVMGYERPQSTDYWDGNWLVTPIEVSLGSFKGRLPADLRSDELRRFRVELQEVGATLTGEAVLSSLDGWITLTVRCEWNGHLTIEGRLDDQPGIGNKLSFRITDLDQSDLAAIIASLQAIEERFPVRSSPSEST